MRVVHSRPFHPQTLGKDERFHRTLKAELLGVPLSDLDCAQRRFDRWRQVYNHERPHEALDDAVPASRYRSSQRAYPESLPPVEYPAADHVRKVQDQGRVDFRGERLRVPQAFRGYPVALRPLDEDGRWAVYFHHRVHRRSRPAREAVTIQTKCPICLRTPVRYVSGLNTRVGGWAPRR